MHIIAETKSAALVGALMMSHPALLVPHSVCWAAAPHLIWTMVVTNAITFLSYTSICITLLVMAWRTQRVILRDWGYFAVGFALFIVACGSTHLLEVITTWNPIFWVDAWTNIVTAVLSAWVAIGFARRSGVIAFGINDYAARLEATEQEKRRVEESLLAAQRLEEWSRMSTVLAHEISNPLEGIQNLLYLIRTSDGNSREPARYATAAEEEIARVIEITRSTLSFFRHSGVAEPVDLRAAAESVRFLVAPLLSGRHLTMQVNAAADVVVEAFPGEVRQVLLNLVRNALEASPPGGQVIVTLNGGPGAVEIVIADQGAGIPADLLPSLFQFGASTKGHQGNGLGLWTVKHILSRHGGSVGVKSSPEQGTEFRLLWPRKPPAEVEARESAPAMAARPAGIC
jgi:signal transduction histidine kinase